jgi:hypothetical protein
MEPLMRSIGFTLVLATGVLGCRADHDRDRPIAGSPRVIEGADTSPRISIPTATTTGAVASPMPAPGDHPRTTDPAPGMAPGDQDPTAMATDAGVVNRDAGGDTGSSGSRGSSPPPSRGSKGSTATGSAGSAATGSAGSAATGSGATKPR